MNYFHSKQNRKWQIYQYRVDFEPTIDDTDFIFTPKIKSKSVKILACNKNNDSNQRSSRKIRIYYLSVYASKFYIYLLNISLEYKKISFVWMKAQTK